MAKKKNDKDKNQDESEIVEQDAVFDETLPPEDGEDFLTEDEAADHHMAEIAEMLADPAKATKIVEDVSEEVEDILYCPKCGIDGLFVNNVCVVCGTKKAKKSDEDSADEFEDDLSEHFENNIDSDEYQ
jgi:hypothetical protein